MVRGLLWDWSIGLISAAKVQRVCVLDWKDEQRLLANLGVSAEQGNSVLKSFANMGNKGNSPNHINNAIISWLGEADTPEAINVPVHMRIQRPNHTSDAVDVVDLPIMLPHEIFACLYEKYHTRCSYVFFGEGNDHNILPTFWRGVIERRDPRIIKHPMCLCRDWEKWFIPLSLHGDGVGCVRVGKSGTKTFETTSITGTLAVGSSAKLKLFMAGLFLDSIVSRAEGYDDETDEEIWKALIWSLNAMYEGRWPTHDWKGVKYDAESPEGQRANTFLAGGYRVVIWLLKGDIDYYAKSLWLKHYSSLDFCDYCNSTIDNVDASMQSYKFGPTARWMNALLTAEQWRSNARVVHYVFVHFKFLSILNVEIDELHCKYLGVYPDFLGSLLFVLVYITMEDTPNRNLARVWEQVLEGYRFEQSPSQLNKLDLGSFTNPDSPHGHYPCLRGRGGEIKHIVKPIRHMWRALHDPASPYTHGIDKCIGAMCTMQEVLDDTHGDVFLSTSDTVVVRNATTQFLESYAALASLADAQKQLLFPTNSKLHFLWHWGFRCAFLHPSRSNCFTDEDYMSYVKDCVGACVDGTPTHKVPARFVQKDRWASFMRNKFDM